MNDTETTTCAHHWVIEPARGAISAGVCKLCGAARDDFANSDRALDGDGDAGAGRQPMGLTVLQRGRYTQRLRIRVSMAQRVSYRRSAEEAGVGLMAWCRAGAGSGRIAGPETGARGTPAHRRLHRRGGDHADPVAGGCLPYCGAPERAGTGGVGPECPGLGSLR